MFHQRDGGPYRQPFTPRCGLTLVELLAAVAVLGIIAACLLAAVQRSRESARRAECASNLRQIGIAMSAYQGAFRAFPPGNAQGYSFLATMLPQMEEENLFRQVDWSVGRLLSGSTSIDNAVVTKFHCPSDNRSFGRPVTNYAGNFGSGVQEYGYNGVIRPMRGVWSAGENPAQTYVVDEAQVRDGLSHTAAVGEILTGVPTPDGRRNVWMPPSVMDLPNQLDAFAAACASLAAPIPIADQRGWPWSWGDVIYTGYTHVLVPNRHSCTNGGIVQAGAYTAGSLHTNGANLVYADGHLQFIAEEVDIAVWRAIGSRNGAEAIE